MKIAILEVSHWHVPLYLPAFADLGITPVAVSDEQVEYAERLASQLPGCKAYQDFRVLVEQEQPDFVFAFGRYRLQPEIAEFLLKHRIAFAIEKPVGTDARSFGRLIALAKEQQVFVAVPLTNRTALFSRKVLELQRTGQMGQVRHAHFRYIGGPVQRYVAAGSKWMLEAQESGGGALRNLGVHYMDLFALFTQSKQVRVASVHLQKVTPDIQVEEYAAVSLEGDGGAFAVVEVGYTYPTDAADVVWSATDGRTYVTYRDGATRVATSAGVEEFGGHSVAGLYQQFVKDTLYAFQSGGQPLATLEDMERAMRLVDTCYAVAKG